MYGVKIWQFLIGVIGLAIFICFLAAIPTMLLWNWLMPEICGLPEITFLQAVGVNILTSILFKSSSFNASSSD